MCIRDSLKVAGSHTQFDDLVNHIDDVISYNRVIGNSRIVCPWYDLKDEEKMCIRDRVMRVFNIIAENQKRGLPFFFRGFEHFFHRGIFCTACRRNNSLVAFCST